MRPLVTAGAGFLLAVLWFDLMFDTLVRGHDATDELPEPVLASIAGYYRRVTTEAHPMGRLVAVAMLATVVALVAQLVRGDTTRWVSVVSLAAALGPIGLAAARTVPAAVRLGARRDPPAVQSALARAAYADHRLCFAGIALLLTVQLAWA